MIKTLQVSGAVSRFAFDSENHIYPGKTTIINRTSYFLSIGTGSFY
jgi:hypothetical protein